MSGLRAWVAKAIELGEFKSTVDWFRPLLDGNRFIQLLEQGPRGHLVGEDRFGNKYFENNDLPYDRKRWVIYKEKRIFGPNSYTPTSIPPEWHAWINYINDYPPTKYEYKKPIYYLASSDKSPTGTPAAYQPKGAWVNPAKRNWLKYQAWAPPGGQQ